MTVFPMKYDGSNTLQDMSATDLQRLIYNLQTAYANQITAGGDGYVFVGSGQTSIGSASDTSATQQTNQTAKGINDGIIQGYPSYPGVGSETDTTYAYRQDRTTPSAPNADTFNYDGMIYFDSANDHIEPFSTEAELAAVIIDQAITNMRTGDEVGSYRVETSTPSNGGAGTWASKGTFFVDSLYAGSSTVYNLYLKLSLDSPPGSDVSPVGIENANGHLIEKNIAKDQELITDLLLPALTRKMSSGLYYSVATSVSGINRGAFTDTKLSGTTNSQNFTGTSYTAAGFYQSISTPSGSAGTVSTYYLNMLA